jgi:hypothetical protein
MVDMEMSAFLGPFQHHGGSALQVLRVRSRQWDRGPVRATQEVKAVGRSLDPIFYGEIFDDADRDLVLRCCGDRLIVLLRMGPGWRNGKPTQQRDQRQRAENITSFDDDPLANVTRPLGRRSYYAIVIMRLSSSLSELPLDHPTRFRRSAFDQCHRMPNTPYVEKFASFAAATRCPR